MCRVWRPRLLSVRNRNRHAHSARTAEGLRKKFKKIMHRVSLSRGRPHVKFLDGANATHSSSFEHTPTPVLCGPYASSSFAKLRVIEYLLPTKLTLLALASLQIPIAFGPNPAYRFSSLSATRGVCQFLSKQARRARFEFIQHIRDLATKMHVTCPQTYLYTTVSCPYEGRAMYTSIYIYIYMV